MAQNFINCSIIEPYSVVAPTGFEPTSADPDLIFFGPARGWVDDVLRVTSSGTGLTLTTVRSYTQGDLLLKYRLLSPAIELLAPGDPALATDQSFTVQIGTDVQGWFFNDQFYTATQKFEVRGVGRNDGTTIPTTNIPAAAGVASYRGPRYMRINWVTAPANLRAKVWHFDKAEPATWQYTATGQPVTAAGPVIITFSSAYEMELDLHWVAISDVPTEPAYKASVTASELTTYPGGAKRVAVRQIVDDNNMPVAASTVRLYHQLTGAFLGETVTDAMGMASFETVNTDGLCYAIAQRTTGGDVVDNFLNKA